MRHAVTYPYPCPKTSSSNSCRTPTGTRSCERQGAGHHHPLVGHPAARSTSCPLEPGTRQRSEGQVPPRRTADAPPAPNDTQVGFCLAPLRAANTTTSYAPTQHASHYARGCGGSETHERFIHDCRRAPASFPEHGRSCAPQPCCESHPLARVSAPQVSLGVPRLFADTLVISCRVEKHQRQR